MLLAARKTEAILQEPGTGERKPSVIAGLYTRVTEVRAAEGGRRHTAPAACAEAKQV